ncbi:TMEM175 family protein [Weissella diestrammenae]|nr:TMEM175 family protein [Weissella diestrammenae]
MKKERMITFLDAMIPIIMIFLVLEFPKPEHISLSTLLELRTDFFAYFVSFFWLGMMWVGSHERFENIDEIQDKTFWATIIMLFFTSLIP